MEQLTTKTAQATMEEAAPDQEFWYVRVVDRMGWVYNLVMDSEKISCPELSLTASWPEGISSVLEAAIWFVEDMN